MAVIINPTDTLQKPSLTLSSDNQFSKITYNSVDSISANQYYISFSNAFSISSKMLQPEGYKNPCTSDINEVTLPNNINTEVVVFNAPQYEGTITDSDSLDWSNISISNFNKNNFKFNIKYRNFHRSSIQTYISATNKTFKYRIFYIEIMINITQNDVIDSTVSQINITPIIKYGINEKYTFSSGSTMVFSSYDDLNSMVATYSLGTFGTILSSLNNIYRLKPDNWYTIPIAIENAPLPSYSKSGVTYPTDNDNGSFSFINQFNLSFSISQLNEVSGTDSVSYGDDSHYTYSFDSNPLINKNTMYNSGNFIETYQASKLLSRYSNGKHYGTITIKVGDYYDSSDPNTKKISPEFESDYKYVGVNQLVRIYINNEENNLVPLLSKNNLPVNFLVISSKLSFLNGILSVVLKIMEQ